MSAIAKTASITLITAVPGSGKTLRTVWYADKAVKAGELVFASNVNGLAIPQVVDFEDPTKWQELPTGSILIVDEAQQFFRAAKSGDPVPDYIKAMETIRHQGIRLILITQHPALIHSNIRALVGLHEHLVRENGKQSAKVYRRNSVIDNVRSHTALAREDSETWAYPKHVFELYKSAEVHTVERKIQSRFKRGVAMLAIAALLGSVVVWRIKDRLSDEQAPVATESADKAQAARADKPAALASTDDSERNGRALVHTAQDYSDRYTPLIANAPWSAPAFVNREPLADPSLVCMSTGAGEDVNGDHRDASCRCVTEQGTRYEAPDAECRKMARNGPMYNPFKSATQYEAQGQVAGMSYSVEGSRGVGAAAPTDTGRNAAASSPGAVLTAPQVSGYGDIAAGRVESAPR